MLRNNIKGDDYIEPAHQSVILKSVRHVIAYLIRAVILNEENVETTAYQGENDQGDSAVEMIHCTLAHLHVIQPLGELRAHLSFIWPQICPIVK